MRLNLIHLDAKICIVSLIVIFSLTATGFKSAMGIPSVLDSKFKAEVYFDKIKLPSSIAFLGPNDVLVLEKDTGAVKRIVNGTMLENPLLKLTVSSGNWSMEQGLLGIAVSKHPDGHTYVFLYYTEFGKVNNGDRTLKPIANLVYRYEFQNNILVHPKLLLDLPATPGPAHNGGAIMIGPDNNLYVPIGDVRLGNTEQIQNKSSLDGRAGILRVTQDGQPVLENGSVGILDDKFPLNLYYGYGIRNSFGIDFDPVTGNLWDTENGPGYGDEINLVKPGFNSGWNIVQGIWKPEGNNAGKVNLNPTNLVDFGRKGKYRPPEFIWNIPVGPSAIKFLSSNKYGAEYKNDIFVGDVNDQNIYHFDLNKKRDRLDLNGALKDKIANTPEELGKIIFATQFGRITDMEVGPDGFLYVVSYITNKQNPFDMTGTIYRIVPVR